MAFASKNLWNLANEHVRQSFIFQQRYLTNTAIFHVVKATDANPRPACEGSQPSAPATAPGLEAFFEAMDVYRECPGKFTGRPRLPNYLHKTRGGVSWSLNSAASGKPNCAKERSR